jgi:hypothetical protein
LNGSTKNDEFFAHFTYCLRQSAGWSFGVVWVISGIFATLKNFFSLKKVLTNSISHYSSSPDVYRRTVHNRVVSANRQLDWPAIQIWVALRRRRRSGNVSIFLILNLWLQNLQLQMEKGRRAICRGRNTRYMEPTRTSRLNPVQKSRPLGPGLLSMFCVECFRNGGFK